MAIYIKGFEKPINCYCCPLSYSENGGLFCYITDAFVGNNPKQDDCPLTEIPEPHGRLIDADWFFNTFTELANYDTEDNAPTVIKGSERDAR